MENASKALLIAAAVLIVILLVAFGVNVFNQSKNAGDATESASQIKGGINAGVSSLNTSLKNIKQ